MLQTNTKPPIAMFKWTTNHQGVNQFLYVDDKKLIKVIEWKSDLFKLKSNMSEWIAIC